MACMDKVRRLCRTLASSLGGEVIATGTGVFAPDVAWASATGAEEVWIVYLSPSAASPSPERARLSPSIWPIFSSSQV